METQKTSGKPARKHDTHDRCREGIASPIDNGKDFNARGREAIADTELHDAMELATTRFVSSRNAATGELPSSLCFHTGPSRSADIGQSLAIGVHGPGEVHVLLVDDLRKNASMTSESGFGQAG